MELVTVNVPEPVVDPAAVVFGRIARDGRTGDGHAAEVVQIPPPLEVAELPEMVELVTVDVPDHVVDPAAVASPNCPKWSSW